MPTGRFDLVTLLIGVNNQYRGRSVDEYRTQFRALLARAIGFAGGRRDSRDRRFHSRLGRDSVRRRAATEPRIAAEIDAFNAVNRDEARRAGSRATSTSRRSRAARPTNPISSPPTGCIRRPGCTPSGFAPFSPR